MTTGLYAFNTPGRVQIDLEGLGGNVWSLWTRVHRLLPVALVQHQDGSWEEFSSLPFTINGPNKFLYGASGFYNSDNVSFDDPIRVYLGGHQYYVAEAQRAELLAAVTAQEPTGYGAYLAASPDGACETGDEFMASGKDTDKEGPTRYACSTDGFADREGWGGADRSWGDFTWGL